MAITKTKKCKYCGTANQEYDHKAIGAEMRALRKVKGLTQTLVANRMKISKPYLCDLENGFRNWRPDLLEKFHRALV